MSIYKQIIPFLFNFYKLNKVLFEKATKYV
jgi:hypothetical protein